MALVVDLDTHGHEALAALEAAAAQDVAAILGLHAGAEAELALAGALGGLVGSFGHKRVGR